MIAGKEPLSLLSTKGVSVLYGVYFISLLFYFRAIPTARQVGFGDTSYILKLISNFSVGVVEMPVRSPHKERTSGPVR